MTVFALCGSFCTLDRALEVLEKLAAKDEVIPVVSESLASCDTRFGRASERLKMIEEICGRKAVTDIVSAEPIGPGNKSDLMVICPCTGNTLAKLSLGITDSVVTMAAKSHLRNERPLVICLASNDALSANLENVGRLMKRKHVYFSPFRQDDPVNKPSSLVFEPSLVEKSVEEAKKARQLHPVFL